VTYFEFWKAQSYL